MTNVVDNTTDIAPLTELARSLASQAKDGEEIEVYVTQGSETEITVYKQEIENMTTANSTAVGIRVIKDHREGSAWAESLDDDVLKQTLANARENASISEPDEFAAMAKPSDIDGETGPERNGWDESVLNTSLQSKIDLVLELDSQATKYDERIKDVPSSDYEDGWGHSVMVNSHGIEITHSSTSASASCSLMLGDEESQESHGFTFDRGFSGLNLDEVIEMAFTRGIRLLRGTQPISSKVPVIFDPLVTTQFFGIITSMLSGGAVAKGRALLADRLGDKIGNSNLTLVDDPLNENAFSSSVYDAEGLPLRKNIFIENGELKQFTHNLYSSRRLNMKPNACAKRGGVSSRPGTGVRALYAETTGESVDEIFDRVGEAIYVQHLLGVHSGVNPLSGDFSVGTQGVWIREGRMAEAFKEATIASDLLTMLSNVSAVANDAWWLPGSIVANTILIDEMVMTGK